MNILSEIFNSEKLHLTHSQKIFIKETYEILSIFKKEVDKIFKYNFETSILSSKDRIKNGELFFRKTYQLRYPITSKKLNQLKKFKIFDLEVNLKHVITQKRNIHKHLSTIKNILTTL
ncbi:MAG: hypothetical protein ABDH23_03035 [Endomicrobiia bacterium]